MSEEQKQEKIDSAAEIPQDTVVTSQHQIKCGDEKVAYTATVGKMVLSEESTVQEGLQKDQYEGSKPRGEFFYTAYTRDGVKDLGKRPLTFAFNGGPGSPSIWVHMGLLGPRRIQLTDEGLPYPPPPQLTDNSYSILDMTDLVFIDPVGTGYSRATKGSKPLEFWGWKKDVESVGEFIRLYVTRNKRWGSPKYIAGESYGTTRATGLADYLSDKHGMYLNGIMLISTALDFSTLDFYAGNELPYLLFFPSYVATAWFHKKCAPEYQKMKLEKLMEIAREFVLKEYLPALFVGDKLPAEQRKALAEKMSRLCGLSAEYLLQADLRVTLPRFSKELLRDQRRTVGRFDGRFLGIDRDAAGEQPEDDPSSYEITGTFAMALNDYLNRELGYETDLEYVISNELWKVWDYKEHQNQYLQLEETLRKTMVRNKFMKVWVLNGYYDMATPFFAAEYVFDHLQLDETLRNNLTMTYYEAGHMMYLHKKSLIKFRKDAEKFYAG